MKKILWFPIVLLVISFVNVKAQEYFIPDEIFLNKKDQLLSIHFDYYDSKYEPVTGLSVSGDGELLSVELEIEGEEFVVSGEGKLLTKSRSGLEIKFDDGIVEEISKDRYTSGIRFNYDDEKLIEIREGIAKTLMRFRYSGFSSSGPLEKVVGDMMTDLIIFNYDYGRIVQIMKDHWGKKVELEYDEDELLTIGGDDIPKINVTYKKR